jgi:hypothetical protein
MILSAGAREVRGEGVGCWAGLDEVDLGGSLGLGDGGVRRKVEERFFAVEWQQETCVRG